MPFWNIFSMLIPSCLRPELYKSMVLELNASDDRGINVVRTKIKDIIALCSSCFQYFRGYPCPPYKITILEEADSMTEDAQACFFCSFMMGYLQI
jgi:DNA polymerase III delta prime subunit